MTGPRGNGRTGALGRLMGAIADMVDAGEIVPCLNEERAYLWLSEVPEAQQAAALGCRGCPALEACRTYVTAWPEPSGVWGGRVGKREVISGGKQLTGHDGAHARVAEPNVSQGGRGGRHG